jgi:hypothetical protein
MCFNLAAYNKPRHLQPSAAATLTSSRACAGRYAIRGKKWIKEY